MYIILHIRWRMSRNLEQLVVWSFVKILVIVMNMKKNTDVGKCLKVVLKLHGMLDQRKDWNITWG